MTVGSPVRLAVYDRALAEAFSALTRRKDADPTHVVRLDSGLERPDATPGATLVRFEDVLVAEDRLALERRATLLARQWFLPALGDVTLYRGVSLGLVVEHRMKIWLSQILKLLRLLDTLQPSQLLFVDNGDWACRTLLAWCRIRAVAPVVVTLDPTPAAVLSAIRMGQPPLTVRAMAWALGRPPTAKRQRTVPYLLAEWYPTLRGHFRALLDSGSATFTFIGPAYDPYLLLSQGSSAVVPLEFLASGCRDPDSCPSLRASLQAAQRLQEWAGTESSIALGPHLWEIDGPTLVDTWHRCGHLVPRLERLIRRVNPSAVLVRQDTSGSSRVLVQVARARGVPSLVATHGIPVAAVGTYPPPLADAIVAWGAGQNEYLVGVGTAADRICYAGNSNSSLMPGYLPSLRRRLARWRWGVCRGGIPVVLFAASPGSLAAEMETPSEENQVLDQVCITLGHVDWLRLIVRLHPSTEAYEPVAVKRAIVATRGQGRITIDPGLRLRTALLAADVVLVTESTVAVEALKLGRPVVQAAILLRPLGLDLSKYGVAHVVSDPQQLPQAVSAALTERHQRPEAWQRRVDRYLAMQLGPQPWTAQPILDMVDHLHRGAER